MGTTDTVASPGEVPPVAAFAPAVAPTVAAVPGAATVGTVSLGEGASAAERVLCVVGAAETVAADAETRATGVVTDGEDGEDGESASTRGSHGSCTAADVARYELLVDQAEEFGESW